MKKEDDKPAQQASCAVGCCTYSHCPFVPPDDPEAHSKWVARCEQIERDVIDVTYPLYYGENDKCFWP